jgi:hypothetical protein
MSSWAASHRPSASTTSPLAAVKQSASARALAAALAVLAAVWGRGTNAASPVRHVRPKAMFGTARSWMVWTNGSACRLDQPKEGRREGVVGLMVQPTEHAGGDEPLRH